MRSLLLVLVAACGAGASGPVSGSAPAGELTGVSFNVHGRDNISDDDVGQAIADQLASFAPDLAPLQECVGCEALLARLPAGYALVEGNEDSGNAILYVEADWTVVDRGTIVLGGGDGWATRDVRWAELEHVDGGRVRVYSTHFCVDIRNPDDDCDAAWQTEWMHRIVDHILAGRVHAILGGDFNVFVGFEDGPVVRYAVEHGLVDTLREITDEPVVTFDGTSWQPQGRIDYLFATAPVSVSAASVAPDSASDHRPVAATFGFE